MLILGLGKIPICTVNKNIIVAQKGEIIMNWYPVINFSNFVIAKRLQATTLIILNL